MIEDSLSYPVRNDWIGRILIGGVLTALGFLLIPFFFVMGYYVRVLEGTTAGDDEPPEFSDWGELFVDGIKATVISLVYSIVPFILWSVLVFGLVGTGGLIGGDGGGLLAGLGFMSMLLVIPLMFLIYYLVPAALANFAHTGSFSAAFDFGAIKPVLLSSDYVIAILIPFVMGIILNIIGFVLGITVVGLLLVPFLSFYAYMAIFRMFGVAFDRTAGRTPGQRSGMTAGV